MFYNATNRKSWESIIIEQQNNRFITEKKYWTDLFKRCNTKIYATVHKWANHQIAASESINEPWWYFSIMAIFILRDYVADCLRKCYYLFPFFNKNIACRKAK